MHKVVFILGCTAVGKGAAGREVARRLGASIVSVDSMKIYRRMDIGTAKPPPEVRGEIPHYCIDLVEPHEEFSVADFVRHADRALADATARGSLPLAVGGTSLYVKALAEGLFEGASGDPNVRADLKARIAHEGLAAMHAELARIDPQAAGRIHPNDQRRIIRALEVHKATGKPISDLQSQWDGDRRHDCLFIGLRRDKTDLHSRINLRVRQMLDRGLRDEVAALLAEPNGLSKQASQAVGYAEMIEHLQGRCTLEEAFEKIKVNTRRLAKKQRTWHRRFRDVHWIDLNGDDLPATIAEAILRIIK